MRAQVPTNSGEARLVPPTCSEAPSTVISAPEFGSASKATSGTPRVVWPAFWPMPDCHVGMGSKVLGLPPVAPLFCARLFHTTSLVQVVVEAFSEVPPTATTYWELAGQLGVVPPVPHSSAPESPE